MAELSKEYFDDHFDKLTISIKHGFEAVDERFKQVDERFEKVDKRFDQIEAKVDVVQGKLDNILYGEVNKTRQ